MSSKTLFVWLIAFTSSSAMAFKWDPIGDIQNPGRIVDNVRREAGNVGAEADRIRLEGMVQAGAPTFEQWLNGSRNTARSGGTAPIPLNIRQQMAGFYDEDILNRVRYKVGDAGVFNLANLSIQYGEAGAVTLIDTIVFKSAQDANFNATLWAHELKHIQQFRDWGTRNFAIRYLRSWNSVENEAHAAANTWTQQRASIPMPAPGPAPVTQQVFFPPPVQQPPARFCATNWGSCQLGVFLPRGANCYCPSMGGPVWGFAQ